jgi:hypothetical protein
LRGYHPPPFPLLPYSPLLWSNEKFACLPTPPLPSLSLSIVVIRRKNFVFTRPPLPPSPPLRLFLLYVWFLQRILRPHFSEGVGL